MRPVLQHRTYERIDTVNIVTDRNVLVDFGKFYFPQLPYFYGRWITGLAVNNTGLIVLDNQPQAYIVLKNRAGEVLVNKMPIRELWNDPTQTTGTFGRLRMFEQYDVDFQNSYIQAYDMGAPIGAPGQVLTQFDVFTSTPIK